MLCCWVCELLRAATQSSEPVNQQCFQSVPVPVGCLSVCFYLGDLPSISYLPYKLYTGMGMKHVGISRA